MPAEERDVEPRGDIVSPDGERGVPRCLGRIGCANPLHPAQSPVAEWFELGGAGLMWVRSIPFDGNAGRSCNLRALLEGWAPCHGRRATLTGACGLATAVRAEVILGP